MAEAWKPSKPASPSQPSPAAPGDGKGAAAGSSPGSKLQGAPPSAPAATGTGSGPGSAAKPAGPGAPAKPAAAAGPGAPAKPAGPGAAAKQGLLDRLKAKAQVKQKRGPGRPAGEGPEAKPGKPKAEAVPLTEAEIEEGARQVAQGQIEVMSSVFGDTWASGAYGKNDVETLTKSHRAWIHHFQIKLPWFITWIFGQMAYNGPRLRDPKNVTAMKSFFKADQAEADKKPAAADPSAMKPINGA